MATIQQLVRFKRLTIKKKTVFLMKTSMIISLLNMFCIFFGVKLFGIYGAFIPFLCLNLILHIWRSKYARSIGCNIHFDKSIWILMFLFVVAHLVNQNVEIGLFFKILSLIFIIIGIFFTIKKMDNYYVKP